MGKSDNSLTLYQPPILGVGASVRLRGGHVALGSLGEFGSDLAKGFTLGLDSQVEQLGHHVLCGSAARSRTAFIVYYEVQPTAHRIRFRLRDDIGRNLIATADLSVAAAKRMIVRINPSHNSVKVTESTIHSTSKIPLEYSRRDGPREFSNFKYPLVLSGFSHDAGHKAKFAGRAANVFLFSTCLSDEQIDGLVQATLRELESAYGMRPSTPPNPERRKLFLEDLAKIRSWLSKPLPNATDTRDASTLLYRWLFDRHPLLQDLCDELGIQLSLPCQSPQGKQYIQKIIGMKPSFYQVGVHGVGALHRHVWQPLSMFREEIAFHVEGHSVSHEGFVKLVRHKLGGSHFDPIDRKKWQRDLKAYSDRIRLSGVQAIPYQMRALLDAIHQAVEGCGIEHQLRIQRVGTC